MREYTESHGIEFSASNSESAAVGRLHLGEFAPSDVAMVLRAWKHAVDMSKENFMARNGEYTQDGSVGWDAEIVTNGNALYRLIDPTRILRRNGEQSTDGSQLEACRELLGDETFDAKGLLIEYLAYQLWVDHYSVQVSMGPPVESIEAYDALQARLSPVIVEALPILAESADSDVLLPIFEKLAAAGELRVVEEALFREGISDDARLKLAVAGMNTFGVIPIIESIATHAKQSAEIANLYKTLHGEEVGEIMEELSAVYKSVDFENYVLNAEELTEQEVGFIRKIIDSVGGEKMGLSSLILELVQDGML